MDKYNVDEELINKLANFYKTMSDPSRMKIIYTLIKMKELCVNDLASIVKMSQTAVSYQLRILRSERIVKHYRDGKMIMYSINDDHVDDVINTTITHLQHED